MVQRYQDVFDRPFIPSEANALHKKVPVRKSSLWKGARQMAQKKFTPAVKRALDDLPPENRHLKERLTRIVSDLVAKTGSLQRPAGNLSPDDFGEAFTSPDEGKFPVKQVEQPKGPWADLLQLKFSIKFDEEKDDVIFRPKFTDKIKSYENKIIEVEGFIIPYEIAANAMGDLSDDGQKFMFSAFPIASCFFCGEAGAESVIQFVT